MLLATTFLTPSMGAAAAVITISASGWLRLAAESITTGTTFVFLRSVSWVSTSSNLSASACTVPAAVTICSGVPVTLSQLTELATSATWAASTLVPTTAVAKSLISADVNTSDFLR